MIPGLSLLLVIFGAGIRGTSDGSWSPAHDVAVAVWGAALYAVRVVTADLVMMVGFSP